MTQKELRKNQKAQRRLSDKDDQESMRKMERLIMEEKEIIQKMEQSNQRKVRRIQNIKEKNLIDSMTFEETCDYFKSKDKDKINVEEHRIPNTREARIHRKRVIEVFMNIR